MSIGSTYSRAATEKTAQQQVETVVGYFGVEGLDILVPQGLTYDSQVLVLGETGVGKSILAAQFLYEGLTTGDTCVYVACDEPLNNMRTHMANFRLGTLAYERTGQLLMLDAYGRALSREARVVPNPANLDEYFLYERRLLEEALARGARVRLVVDSLSTILATNVANEVITFNGHRLRFLRSRRVLTLDNVVLNVLPEQTLAGLTHAYPMILKLLFRNEGGTLTRFLQLGKLKSGQFAGNEHPFTIDARTGLVVR